MKVVCYCFLIVVAAALAVVSVCNPVALNANAFLANFINHEILALQGVVATVSLVSITQAHLEFTRVERRIKSKIFGAARKEINHTAVVLVGSFLLMIGLLFINGSVEVKNAPTVAALCKSANLVLLIASILAMGDIIRISYELADNEPIEGGEESGE